MKQLAGRRSTATVCPVCEVEKSSVTSDGVAGSPLEVDYPLLEDILDVDFFCHVINTSVSMLLSLSSTSLASAFSPARMESMRRQ
ncbi:hypothetical protein Mapa_013226 [Marchantia paleacea]|nr:hypothetical protein Mapa_013226 [Marchantia paleacea]